MEYCEECNSMIDTDYDVDHSDECFYEMAKETLIDLGLPEDEAGLMIEDYVNS